MEKYRFRDEVRPGFPPGRTFFSTPSMGVISTVKVRNHHGMGQLFPAGIDEEPL
jgi:hypothetical protein